MDDANKYQKAFNQGYVLAEHAPTLIEALKPSVDQNNEYLNGILHGAKQYEVDKDLNKGKGHSHGQAIDKKDKDQDLDKQIEHD